MKCVVVYNPRSGSAPAPAELRREFKHAGIDITKLIALSNSTKDDIKKYCKRGSIIAVCGGDGTVSSLVKPIIESGAVLLPLPGGTLNHFTKDLGVPQTLPEALAQAAKQTVRSVDVASINGRYFLNNSAFGLYPSSLQVRARFEDKLGKWPAAIVGVTRAFFNFHHYTVQLNKKTVSTPFIFIGNNTYELDGMGRPRLDDGKLFVAVIHASTRRGLFWLFCQALFGQLQTAKNFDTYESSDPVVIKTRRRHVHIAADGELVKVSSPLEYQMHHNKLRVLG